MHNIIKAQQNQIVIIGRSYLNCFNQQYDISYVMNTVMYGKKNSIIFK